MNRIWIIFILLGAFIVYAYFGFFGEQTIANITPKNDTTANTKYIIRPATKVTAVASQPMPSNKPK